MIQYIYKDSLKSERLISRKLKEDDFKVWAEFFEDEESFAFLPKFEQGNNEDKAKYWIKRQLNRYENNQFGLQAIINLQSQELMGLCGLLLQDVDGKQEIEVGYHFLKSYRNFGYATEAAKLFIDFAFENNLCESVISIIQVKNTRSIKVAEKNGLRKQKQIHWNDLDIFIYRLEAP